MRRFAAVTMSLSALVLTLGVVAPASADHTDPRVPLAPTDGATETGITRGDGVWQHIANFPGLAGPQLTGGGTDLEFFKPQRSTDTFGAFGTLGQETPGASGSGSSG